jgi:2-dehydro-3-deoxy-L-rhamnonate dehydrogenase (NAD+)
MNQIDLSGRAAIVTGGARGIGLAIAERLIKSGARVSIWDRDAETAAAAAKRVGAAARSVEVSDAEAVSNALATMEKEIGPVDILVTSAAIGGANTTVAEYPIETWRQVLDINLTGVFICCRAVIPGIVRRSGSSRPHRRRRGESSPRRGSRGRRCLCRGVSDVRSCDTLRHPQAVRSRRRQL